MPYFGQHHISQNNLARRSKTPVEDLHIVLRALVANDDLF